MAETHIWDLWYPEAASAGLPFARGKLAPSDVLWVHAAPPVLSATVRDGEGRVLAKGERLRRAGPYSPMTRLRREGDRLDREDRWPVETDLGSVVILPGGEVGQLLAWWNAEDGSEWRWQVEFYNHR